MDMLPLIWMLFLVAAIGFYVLLDGFSLGVGILFPFAEPKHRATMMGSVSPVWDGNQTWLIGGGSALLTGFPKAFHLLCAALYLPLMFMLIALVFRGVAFEFYGKAKDKRLWTAAFIGGSTLVAFCQGLILGSYVLGFEYDGRRLVFGAWDFISPFSLLTGVGVVLAYALLGACWLILKTEGELRDWSIERARRLLPLVVLMVGLVSVWTPLAVPAISERWFAMPNLILLSPIPIWTLVMAFVLYRVLKTPPKQDGLPFITCIGLYLLTLIGLGISLWPHIVPRAFTLWDVAAPPESLLFAMVGVLLIVPVVLVYTAHSYYVFRGKVRAEDLYH